MRYEQAIEYLYALEPRGMSLGLRPIRRALALRGHPERGFRSVHVAGTNGKGSVSAMIASVLSASGARVGLFTSPHLHRLVERFRVDGRAMGTRELGRRVGELKSFLEGPRAPKLTFFEVCTLLAFEWFRDAGCDLAVIEVGIGGRLDSTNVLTPALSVITSVALDHQDKLGPTLRHIAREKAGIIKPRVPVVFCARERAVASVITQRAERLAARCVEAERAQSEPGASGRHRVRFDGRPLSVRIPLVGDYQADNLGCAVAALDVLQKRGVAISAAALRRGLWRVRWPGRLELLPGAPDVLCDAAHNPAAARELATHVRGLPHARKVLLFGVLKDKDYEEMLSELLPCFDACVFATPASPRALASSDLRARFGGAAFNNVDTALKHARKLAKKRGLVVAAGSIFLMSAVRARVLGLREDPKIAL